MKKILVMVFCVAFTAGGAGAFEMSWPGSKDKGAPGGKAEQLYNQARGAYGSADYSKAIDYAGQAIRADAAFAKAYVLRGKAFKDSGDVDAAVKDLNKAIQLDPKLGEAFYLRGQTSEIMGEMDKAKADYRKGCAAGYRDACR